MTAVLADYSAEIIRYVTDPRTGISTHEKFRAFMPNPGEVKAVCEDQAERVAALNRYGPPIQIDRQEVKHVHWATVFVPAENARYPAMLAKSKDKTTDKREFYFDEKRPGIWVIRDWLTEPKRGSKSSSTA